MIDKEIIYTRLIELEKYYRELSELKTLELEDLQEKLKTAWMVEHGLQLSTQIILDIGNHILSSLGQSDIIEYKDIIRRLAKTGILPDDFASKIIGLAGLRNVLVHEYLQVDLSIIHDILTNKLDDLVTFSNYIREYIEKEP